MSARKVPLFKKFLEPVSGPAPAVFPIPEGELVKIHYALEHPPVHPACFSPEVQWPKSNVQGPN